jgi:hydroxymethylpyrimidine/phosphomethylpyrimidine kinase
MAVPSTTTTTTATAPHAVRGALSIAGSDSGGGAGVQADLLTFAAHHVWASTALTAVTAQNTTGVSGVLAMPPALVRQQIEAVLADLPVHAAKTGMLANAEIVGAVADALAGPVAAGLPVVVDPVCVAKSGHALLDPDALEAVKRRLLPLARVVTPNLPEARALLGIDVHDEPSQERAGRLLLEMGAQAALIKGGHGTSDELVDVLVTREADGAVVVVRFAGQRLQTPHTHGTGCTLAAATAAWLAWGLPVTAAVTRARLYVRRGIAQAPGIGAGHGPLHHLHRWHGFERPALTEEGAA